MVLWKQTKKENHLWMEPLTKVWDLESCLECLPFMTTKVGTSTAQIRQKKNVWWLSIELNWSRILFSPGTAHHTKEELLWWLIKRFKMKTDFMRVKWCKIEWNEGLMENSLHYICPAWGKAGGLPSPIVRTDKAFPEPTQKSRGSYVFLKHGQIKENKVEYDKFAPQPSTRKNSLSVSSIKEA